MAVSEPPAWPPHFKRRLTDFETRDGDQEVEFVVIVDAKPKATIRWLCDGVQLWPGANVRFEEPEPGHHQLWLGVVNVENTGNYSCEATNNEGFATTTCHCTVIAKPNFTLSLEDLPAVAPNSDLCLHVKITGQPRPDISWLKNGEKLEQSSRITFDERSLTVHGVTDDDAAVYTCEATNYLGQTSSSSKVTVLGKPVLKRDLSDVEV